jgi:SSS family solute:Na+ symporter
MKLKITSAYELLESRLGVSVRITGSVTFILTRLVWMALVLYLAAKALIVMLEWPENVIPWVTAGIGLVAVLYTAVGGLRAVILTDVIQFFVLFSGAVLTIVFISIKLGGVSEWFPTAWADHWQRQQIFSFDPHTRLTVIGSMTIYSTWWILTAGSDQVAIQRYLATRDVKTARRAFLGNLIYDCAIGWLLAVVGFALLGFFLKRPELLPEGKNIITDADFLFPHYIANFLPAGVSGLVVSGLFAAAMSSLDSGVNSIVTVFTTDFLGRFGKKKFEHAHNVKLAKVLALIIGGTAVFISSIMDKIPGNILEVSNKTNGLFVAPLFGLFFMAMFVRFATSFGAIIGAVYSLSAAAIIAYWDVLTGDKPLSFQIIAISSLVTHIVTGCIFSLLPTKGKKPGVIVLWSFLVLIPLAVVWVYVLRLKA